MNMFSFSWDGSAWVWVIGEISLASVLITFIICFFYYLSKKKGRK